MLGSVLGSRRLRDDGYRAVDDIEDRTKVVSHDEIKKDGWTQNTSRYLVQRGWHADQCGGRVVEAPNRV